MTTLPRAHIEPSKHSTPEVDAELQGVEDRIDRIPGAGSPAIMPNKALDEDGKPLTDSQPNTSI